MTGRGVTSWDGDSGTTAPDPGFPIPRAPFGGAPRLAHLSANTAPSRALAAAAMLAQVERRAIGLADLADDAGALLAGARLLWVTLDADPGAALIASLARAHDDLLLPLVFELSDGAIDAIWAAFGDRDGVTILIDPNEADAVSALALGLAGSRAQLNSPVVDLRDQRIDRLQDEVQRISRLLSRLALDEGARVGGSEPHREPASPFIEDHVRSPQRNFAGAAASDPSLPPIGPRDVRRIIRQRRMRDEYFGSDMFADPAWDILLDLYAAKLERHRVSVSSLCIAAAVRQRPRCAGSGR